jgi:hypothetical protein
MRHIPLRIPEAFLFFPSQRLNRRESHIVLLEVEAQ